MIRKAWTIALLILAAAVAAAFVIAIRTPDPGISATIAQRQPDVLRGQYVYELADCAACHTKPGGTTLAGGLGLVTPLGTIYATNITPDRDTGIGNYSLTDFVRALRLGVRRDGARLYPAMPYTAYAKISDEDLQDLFAYLQKDITPVSQTAPANTLAWPFNMRWPIAFWNVLFLDSSRLTPDPSKDPQWNRGAYLVEALAHCGECHTPRNPAFGLDNRRKFAGAAYGWLAYNITSDRGAGIGSWSDEEVFAYLIKGHTTGRGTASGPMGEVVDYSLSLMEPADIRALVTYLRSIPAIASSEPATIAPPAPASPKEGGAVADALGRRVFAQACASCHDWTGVSALSPFATISGSRAVNDPSATNVAQIVISGTRRFAPGRLGDAGIRQHLYRHGDRGGRQLRHGSVWQCSIQAHGKGRSAAA
jgi:mono/diheme cytochrome c family protein